MEQIGSEDSQKSREGKELSNRPVRQPCGERRELSGTVTPVRYWFQSLAQEEEDRKEKKKEEEAEEGG